jgi:hypothetical protein
MWNRRSFPRWPITCEVMCGDGKDFTHAEGLEISEVGIAFTTAQEFSVGSELDLRFRLTPAEDWVDVKAAVRHRLGNKFGAEFLNLPLKERVKFWGHNMARTDT